MSRQSNSNNRWNRDYRSNRSQNHNSYNSRRQQEESNSSSSSSNNRRKEEWHDEDNYGSYSGNRGNQYGSLNTRRKEEWHDEDNYGSYSGNQYDRQDGRSYNQRQNDRQDDRRTYKQRQNNGRCDDRVVQHRGYQEDSWQEKERDRRRDYQYSDRTEQSTSHHRQYENQRFFEDNRNRPSSSRSNTSGYASGSSSRRYDDWDHLPYREPSNSSSQSNRQVRTPKGKPMSRNERMKQAGQQNNSQNRPETTKIVAQCADWDYEDIAQVNSVICFDDENFPRLEAQSKLEWHSPIDFAADIGDFCDGNLLKQMQLEELESVRNRAMEHSRFAEVIEKVYYNHLVMNQILSYITDHKTRLRIAVSSQWLYKLVVEQKVPCDGEHLLIEYNHEHGVYIYRFGTNPESGRFDSMETLVDYLYGVFKFCHYRVTRLTLKGSEDVPLEFHPFVCIDEPDPELLITLPLMEFCNEMLRDLRRLSLWHVEFHHKALDYLLSAECDFVENLDELCLDKVLFVGGSDIADGLVNKLINLPLSRLSIKNQMDLGSRVVDRLKTLNTTLDSVSADISCKPLPDGDGEDFGMYLEGLGSLCTDFEVTISHASTVLGLGRRGALFESLVSCATIQSLTGISLAVAGKTDVEIGHIMFFIEQAKHLPKLRSVHLEAPRRSVLTVAMLLSHQVFNWKNLEKLSLSMFWEDGDNHNRLVGHFDTMIRNLPKSLRSLRLHNSAFTDRSLAMIADFCPDLTNLKIKNMRRMSSKGLSRIIDLYPNLEELSFDSKVESILLKQLCNTRKLPNLKKGKFIVNSLTMTLQRMLEEHFKKVTIERVLKSGVLKSIVIILEDGRNPDAPSLTSYRDDTNEVPHLLTYNFPSRKSRNTEKLNW